jgi:hypothetical protein
MGCTAGFTCVRKPRRPASERTSPQFGPGTSKPPFSLTLSPADFQTRIPKLNWPFSPDSQTYIIDLLRRPQQELPASSK